MTDPVVIERMIDASPEEAFALLTQPERLRRWQALSASVDLRVGGDYRMTIVPGAIAEGSYKEIEPGKRVLFTWGWAGSEDVPPGSSEVLIELEPYDGQTLVRFSHSGLDPKPAASHSEGWEHYADRWDVIAPDGRILGTRVLLHPHVHEQPFTRSMGGVFIPKDITEVTVKARCNIDGYIGEEIVLTLER